MTIKEIGKVSHLKYDEDEWAPLIKFFRDRYWRRYFNPIKVLQCHADYEIRNYCGFLITTIDCILIETLEQFYSGTDESDANKLHDPFYKFFQRVPVFAGVIKENVDAAKFAGIIRSGLIHQSKTKKNSIINKKSNIPILDWVDTNNKSKGFMLNRDKFHEVIYDEYEIIIDKLKEPNNIGLRKNFKLKLITLIDN